MFEALGLKEDEELKNNWYGKIGNYYFIVTPVKQNDKECLSFICTTENNGLVGKLIDFVEEKKRTYSDFIDSYLIDNDKIVISFVKTENDANICAVMKDFCYLLSQNEAKSSCIHCGNTTNLGFYRYNQGLCVLCDSCGDTLIQKIGSIKGAKNNYFTGFLGSLIGALLGASIWVLIGALNFYASAAGYAIAFGAFFGYKKFKGKLTKAGFAINIVTIIFAFLFANIMGTYIVFNRDYPCGLGQFLLIYPYLYTIPENLKKLLLDLGLGVLFMVLGCRTTIKTFYRDAKNQSEAVIEKLKFFETQPVLEQKSEEIKENIVVHDENLQEGSDKINE